MPLQRSAAFLVFFIVATSPLIFGAVHPIVQGIYVFLMLVGCGGWLLLVMQPGGLRFPSIWLMIPLVLIAYTMFQTLPLPLGLIEQISPNRADRIIMVNELAGTTVTWTTISDTGSSGMYRSFLLLGLVLYFFTVLKLCNTDPKFLHTLVLCLVAIGALEAVYGILQFLRPQLGILWLKLTAGRAAYGTIIYKNQYASMLNMIWPLAITAGALYLLPFKRVSTAISPRLKTTRLQYPLLLFSAGLMIIAVLFSLSRGGILSMVCVALLLSLFLPFTLRAKIKFMLLFGLLVLGYVVLLGPDTIISRFDSISASGGTRIAVYRYTMPMLLDHWMTGIGVGSYFHLSPIYLKEFPATIHFFRAHNEFLELLVELGGPAGLLLFCWIGVGMITFYFRLAGAIRRENHNIGLISIGIAALCGLTGFLVHGLVDFGWRLPSNLIIASTLMAILVTCVRHSIVEASSEPNEYPTE